MSGNSTAQRATDQLQQHIVEYAHWLNFDALSREAVHATKALTIDTLGVLIGGFCYEPCRMARNLAMRMPSTAGATIIGDRIRTSTDMAAFVNATTARYVEANDVYARYKPGSAHGHPSDVIMPLFAVAEQVHASGREFIASIVLAYEVYLALCDTFHNKSFDPSTFGCAAVSVAAAKLLRLSEVQTAHALSMAIVPNNILVQVRQSHVTMWKAAAAGKAGQAGVFAATLARAGMEGPHLPFEGKAGWCAHIAREPLTLEIKGGRHAPFLILASRIKPRPARALTVASIMAAEKLAAELADVSAIQEVLVEVHKQASHGTSEHHWHPDTRETADHSIPYVVAAALMTGLVTPRSFDDAMLWNPRLRQLMPKISVIENHEYTLAFEGLPQQYRARVTVTTSDGLRLTAESGGDADDLAATKSDAQVADKFRIFTEDLLGTRRVHALLERLWQLENIDDVALLPPELVLV